METLLFFHFVIILKVKKNEDLKKNFQLLFDNIFQNIEVNIRELGYGDTKVNKTMKYSKKIKMMKNLTIFMGNSKYLMKIQYLMMNLIMTALKIAWVFGEEIINLINVDCVEEMVPYVVKMDL